MPYNAKAILPPEEISGQASLPMARVKRIINVDEDVHTCSANAAYVIAVATEMFVQYLAQQSHNVIKSERKPRRNVQYKDVANAVARIDNLEFLVDVVPRTMSYKQFKKDAVKKTPNAQDAPAGQSTLDTNGTLDKATNGHTHENEDGSDDTRPTTNHEAEPMDIEIRGPRIYHASGQQGSRDEMANES